VLKVHGYPSRFYPLLINQYRCNVQKVWCVQVAGAQGQMCEVCTKVKQWCGTIWEEGADTVGNAMSGVFGMGDAGMRLLERLVVRIEGIQEGLDKIHVDLSDMQDEEMDNNMEQELYAVWCEL
jgi:hypothetical protein